MTGALCAIKHPSRTPSRRGDLPLRHVPSKLSRRLSTNGHLTFDPDDDEAVVPSDPGDGDSVCRCRDALTQERYNTSLLLNLVNLLRTVITLLTGWRPLIPDERSWSVCGNGDDCVDEAELSPQQAHFINVACFVFDPRMSFLPAPGPLHIQQEKDPDAPVRALGTSYAPCATDFSLDGTTPAVSDGGSLIDGLSSKKSPARVIEPLGYVLVESVPLSGSLGSCASHATDISLDGTTPAVSDGGSLIDGLSSKKSPARVIEPLGYALVESAPLVE